MFTTLILICHFILFAVCMYDYRVCACGYEHTCGYLYLCICMQISGGHWMYSSITPHFLFNARSLPEPGACGLSVLLGWKPAVSSIFPPLLSRCWA